MAETMLQNPILATMTRLGTTVKTWVGVTHGNNTDSCMTAETNPNTSRIVLAGSVLESLSSLYGIFDTALSFVGQHLVDTNVQVDKCAIDCQH